MHDNDSSGAASQALPDLTPRRVARPTAAAADAVILADISDSMNDRDGVGGREAMPLRRIERLARVLEYLLRRVRVRSLICFNDVPVEIGLAGRVALPEPGGSTNLGLALESIGALRPNPRRAIIISDGMPNSVPWALEAARALKPMVLDCYYVGPEGLEHALSFMRDLSACGGPGGRSGHFDLVDPVLLGSELERRLLLRAPQ